VRFRQKGDRKTKEGSDRSEHCASRSTIAWRIELFERARVTRDQDVVNGEYIFLDQRTDSFGSAAKAPPPPRGA